MLPPAAPPPAQPPREAVPIQVAGRVGFGIGIFASPGGGSISSFDALGTIQSVGGSYFGGSVGIRWWAKERLAVLPSLSLSISRTTIPSITDIYGNYTQGSSFTNGTIAPALSLGYAA